MSYNLFLDDERNPSDVTWVNLPMVHWEVIRNYDDFVKIIKEKGLPIRASFDHDLADEHYNAYVVAHDEKMISRGTIRYDRFKEMTGYDCAKWLVEYCMERGLSLPEFWCHSFNPIGKENILSILNGYKKYTDDKQ